MPDISVRKLDQDTIAKLRVRAAREGVSMEEAVRRILRQAVQGPASAVDVFTRHFGPLNGVELELPERETHEPVAFE